MNDWMNEAYGIPHKNGHVRFYIVGYDEDLFGYLGWFDMTDWNKGFGEVLKAANKIADEEGMQIAFPLKGEYLEEYIEDIQYAIQERDSHEDNK